MLRQPRQSLRGQPLVMRLHRNDCVRLELEGRQVVMKVVKTTIFLSSMDLFAEVNEAYASYFADAPPARATVAVAGLPKEVEVEIEVVGYC